MKNVVTILLICLSTNLMSQEVRKEIYTTNLDLDSLYHPFTGSFVILNLDKDNEYMVYNDSLYAKRYPPCSTFKITNSLIALQAGVADDENFTIEYDSLKNPPEPWWYSSGLFKHWMKDQTMQSAITHSVVWYYQEIARRIGEETMQKYLHQIDYGNNDISAGIDKFWLCQSLRISAREQVGFLRQLYNNQLPGFSIENQETVKQIMLYESTDDYKLYGKTGGGRCWPDQVIGWYVGFIETETNTYIFAMNMLVNEFSDFDNNRRRTFTKDVLKKMEIIE